MADARINREKKTFIFEDGKEIPIPADKVKQVLRSSSAKKLKEEEKQSRKKFYEASPFPSFEAGTQTAYESLLGDPGGTAYDYLRSGGKAFSKKEGQEEFGFVDRILDNFYALQDAKRESLSDIQAQHPTATTVGKGVGMVGELGLLRRVPGVAALPIMGAGHSETSFLEPGEKAKEVGKDALTGFVLDRFFRGLGNIASQRGARRGAQEGIARTEGLNAAEMSRVEGLNAAEQGRFAQETAAREAQVLQQPALQATENQNFFLTSLQNLGRSLKNIGKQSVGAETAGVEEFIENAINTTGRAASQEGNFTSRFLRSIFKGDKDGKLSAESIKKGMQALDEGIATQGGMAREILTDYKSFLIKRLPENLSSGYAFSKWSPRIVGKTIQNLEQQISKVLSLSPMVSQTISQKLGGNFSQKTVSSFEKAIKDVLQKHQGNISKGLSGGQIDQEIVAAIRATPEYEKLFNSVSNFKLVGKGSGAQAAKSIDPEILKRSIPGFVDVEQAIASLPEAIGERFSLSVKEAMPEISRDIKSVYDSSARNLRNVPHSPQIVPPPAPVSPVNLQQPNIQTPPPMPEPRGLYGQLAHGLERFREQPLADTLRTAKGAAGMGFLGQIAGLPMKAVAGAGLAGYAALRGLTSPSTAGTVVRGALDTASKAIYMADELAQRYPSYANGILQNPEERRSLSREIEDTPEFTLSEKALLQSKVNRGKPISSRLN